jgi:hypothetical protein
VNVSDCQLGVRHQRFTDLDPSLRSGWGVRPGDWSFGASVQQEILPRVSVNSATAAVG